MDLTGDNFKNLQLFNGKVVCPRCDGNGLVYKVQIVNLKENLLICDECEASWKENIEISKENFIDLSSYLESQGSTYKEAELLDLGYEWYKVE